MNIDFDLLRGKKVLCALSGGADSMCLLHCLYSAGIDVAAAHYEHGIRGEESLRDMRFAAEYCAGLGIDFVCEQGDVPGYAKAKAMGIEEAARQLRYEFLERQRDKLGCELIATAHNADDRAETVLMNLIRGSGAKGLSGIPRRRGNIVRPLLDVTRAEIEEYLAEHNVPHVEDSTNALEDYTRNLVRRRLMPLIGQINPGFVAAAGRSAELMARDEDCLMQQARDFIARNNRESIELSRFNSLHPALASRVLRELIPGLNMEHVEDVLAFAAARGYGLLDLPGRRIVRDAGRLYLSAPSLSVLSEQPIEPCAELRLPEAGLSLNCEICEYMGEVNDLFKTSYLKYEIINSNLRVGPRRGGDKLHPLGRGCGKTLKALFMEADYPRQLRDCCPVLRSDMGVHLVYGLAIDERAVPKAGEKALKITFKKINSDTGE